MAHLMRPKSAGKSCFCWYINCLNIIAYGIQGILCYWASVRWRNRYKVQMEVTSLGKCCYSEIHPPDSWDCIGRDGAVMRENGKMQKEGEKGGIHPEGEWERRKKKRGLKRILFILTQSSWEYLQWFQWKHSRWARFSLIVWLHLNKKNPQTLVNQKSRRSKPDTDQNLNQYSKKSLQMWRVGQSREYKM